MTLTDKTRAKSSPPSDNVNSDDLANHRLIKEQEAANFLGYTIRALQNWRLRGGGPKFIKVSKRSIRYRHRDLIQWSEERLRSSTSEDTA